MPSPDKPRISPHPAHAALHIKAALELTLEYTPDNYYDSIGVIPGCDVILFATHSPDPEEADSHTAAVDKLARAATNLTQPPTVNHDGYNTTFVLTRPDFPKPWQDTVVNVNAPSDEWDSSYHDIGVKPRDFEEGTRLVARHIRNSGLLISNIELKFHTVKSMDGGLDKQTGCPVVAEDHFVRAVVDGAVLSAPPTPSYCSTVDLVTKAGITRPSPRTSIDFRLRLLG